MDTNNEIFSAYPDIVSIAEMMQMLRIGRSLAYRILKEGKIRTVTIGNKYIIPKSSVIAFVCNSGSRVS